VPTQTAECLLRVAVNPGITMQKLSDETGLSQSSISRNVGMLSKYHGLVRRATSSWRPLMTLASAVGRSFI
jgi:hypothetical protein